MRRNWRRTAIRILLIVAAITYSGMVWEAVAGFPLDPSRSYLSELAAVDQPLGMLFRLLDGMTAILVLAALVLLRRRTKGSGLVRGSEAALAAFAVLTLVDASSPMACATSASTRCAAADAAGALGISHQIHTASSASASAAVVVSAVLLAMEVLRSRPRNCPNRRAAVLTIAGALAAVTALVTVLAVLSTGDGQLVFGGGWAQRVQVLCVSAYLVAFGFAVTRPPSAAASSVGTAPGSVG